jgi:hypothetical protein
MEWYLLCCPVSDDTWRVSKASSGQWCFWAYTIVAVAGSDWRGRTSFVVKLSQVARGEASPARATQHEKSASDRGAHIA